MPPFRLLPHEEQFFTMFQRAADNLATAGEALVDLTANYVDVECKVAQMKEIDSRLGVRLRAFAARPAWLLSGSRNNCTGRR